MQTEVGKDNSCCHGTSSRKILNEADLKVVHLDRMLDGLVDEAEVAERREPVNVGRLSENGMVVLYQHHVIPPKSCSNGTLFKLFYIVNVGCLHAKIIENEGQGHIGSSTQYINSLTCASV